MCKFFLQGACTRGDACTFSHGEQAVELYAPPPTVEGKFKVTPCKFFLEGRCTRGDACTFSHGEQEAELYAPPIIEGKYKTTMCTFFLEGRCTKGAACTFSHGEDDVMPIGSPSSGKGGKAKSSYGKAQSWGPPAIGKASHPYGMGGKGNDGAASSKGFGKADSKGDEKGKGKNKGKEKGKEKGKGLAGKGHLLPRTRITDQSLTGTVLEWKGKFGWIEPAEPIEHEKAAKRDGKIWVSVDDIVDGTELIEGAVVEFQLWEDDSGLGAEEVIQY